MTTLLTIICVWFLLGMVGFILFSLYVGWLYEYREEKFTDKYEYNIYAAIIFGGFMFLITVLLWAFSVYLYNKYISLYTETIVGESKKIVREEAIKEAKEVIIYYFNYYL